MGHAGKKDSTAESMTTNSEHYHLWKKYEGYWSIGLVLLHIWVWFLVVRVRLQR